ncbi:MAG TPA: hypothetical protein VKX16_16125 [Chloroflexota bacterium]|nr:hypothetical protein [Chloroflexota bacterium]
MYQYSVPVRNEATGEVRIVEVESTYDVDAQILALRELFKSAGWRKATALPATAAATDVSDA